MGHLVSLREMLLVNTQMPNIVKYKHLDLNALGYYNLVYMHLYIYLYLQKLNRCYFCLSEHDHTSSNDSLGSVYTME